MRITFSQLGHWGRLGNQLFQIASTVGLAEQYGAEVAFPPWGPAPFFTYQPPVGPAEPKGQQRGNYYDDTPIAGSCDLHGYMQSYKRFPADWKERFKFTPEFLAKMKSTLPPGWFDKPTVCIHIRRGDMVNQRFGLYTPPIQFFFSAIETHFGNLDGYNFYVISDDIPYCRTYFECLPSVLFASPTAMSEEHMALGSLMQHFIISGSTFGWWTAWLGEKTGSKVVYASRLYNDNRDTPGYWPDHWIKHDGPDYRFNMRDLTFVLRYKHDHNDRYENFVASTEGIRRACNTYIALGEQGRPTLAGDKRLDVYMFMYDLPGPFHTTRITNRVVRRVNTPYIVLWDVDCFVSPLALYVMVYRLRCGVSMVYPYRQLSKCPRFNYGFLLEGALEKLKVSTTSQVDIPPGGAIGFNRTDFIQGGMQNEHFIEWGCEDNEMKERMIKLGFKHTRVAGRMYHAEHFRLPSASARHPHYQANKALLVALRNSSRSELEAAVSTWPWRTQYV